MKELENECSKSPECVGFTSDGYLKNSLSHIITSSTTTLYAKHNVPAPSTDPYLVPMPQQVKIGSTVVGIPFSLSFSTNIESYQLDDAIRRYYDIIFAHPPSARAQKYPVYLTQVKISVSNGTVPLQPGVDESYTISIPSDGTAGQITSKTIYGAYRALETLSQLIAYNFLTHSYEISVTPVSITDFPRFLHRGILVDTSRHFQPLESLMRVIDSISYAKFNTFHWHVVDSQSFPLESTTYPALWNGAYSPQERYTQEDVAFIVEYAAARGIRTMMEIDVPGHAASWCVGEPQVCPSPSCTQPLNPATNATFNLIQSLLGEITGGKQGGGLIPDNFLHLGGDEVDTSCWTETPSVNQWLLQNNYTADQAYMYFVERVHSIALAQGRNPVNWEEVFLHFGTQLDPRSIIHIWLDHATLQKVVAAGYRGILSNQDVWYLDHLDVTWEQFYLNDPFANITSPVQQALVLGGEVCMWGETVDASDIQQTIWPRAAAAAERLWSNALMNNTDEFLPRLESFRCTLNQRGIAAAPTLNANARMPPTGPGSCYVQ